MFVDHYARKRKGKDKDNDPTYGWKPSSQPRPPRPSNLRQSQSASYGSYQYCTAACLKALKAETSYPNCPNIDDHRAAGATTETVIEDVFAALCDSSVDMIGSGTNSRCFSVRTLGGYTVLAKVFNENAEGLLFETEVAAYEHLRELQGAHVPVILATTESVFAGTIRNIIIMSYGGVSADKCTVNNEVIDRILKAFKAIHSLGIWHQDIALRNILVDKDGSVNVIDFESAVICEGDVDVVAGEQDRVEEACKRVKASGNIADFIL